MLFTLPIGSDDALKKLILNHLETVDHHISMIHAMQSPNHYLFEFYKPVLINEYKLFPVAFSISPLYWGAIMGWKSWTDVDVVSESSPLLGPGRFIAYQLIPEWRAQ